MNILGLPYTNLQSQAYACVAEQAINTGALLNNAIANTAAATLLDEPVSRRKSRRPKAARRLLPR